MCGRFSLTTPIETLYGRYNIYDQQAKLPIRYNIAPSQTAAIVRNSAPHQFTLAIWGLPLPWKDEASGDGLINIRSESLGTKPMFDEAFRDRRCLIPADGFYEWKREGDRRLPYRIIMEDKSVFSFAGIWQESAGEEGGAVIRFAIITVPANERVGELHDRMPAILKAEDEQAWIDTNSDSGALKSMIAPAAAGLMTIYPVSSLINNPKNDAPSLIVPLHYGGA